MKRVASIFLLATAFFSAMSLLSGCGGGESSFKERNGGGDFYMLVSVDSLTDGNHSVTDMKPITDQNQTNSTTTSGNTTTTSTSSSSSSSSGSSSTSGTISTTSSGSILPAVSAAPLVTATPISAIPLQINVPVTVSSGDKLEILSADTIINVVHTIDSNTKVVMLISGSANLIKGNAAIVTTKAINTMNYKRRVA